MRRGSRSNSRMRRRSRSNRTFLGRLPLPERTFVADALRTERVGGMLLLAAAAVALVWANTPLREAYDPVRDFHFGIEAPGAGPLRGPLGGGRTAGDLFLSPARNSSASWVRSP